MRTKRRMKKTTTIRAIVDPGDPALDGAYALLTTAFHRTERVKRREWVGSLREGASGLLTDVAWHLLVAEQDDVVVGLASGTYLGNVNVGVVGYLAIVSDVRGLGIGTRLRRRLRQYFERDARRLSNQKLGAIIGEVSESNPWIRVLQRREGVLLLDFTYYQPRLHDDHDASPFLLYYESLQQPRARLPVAELRRILYSIWRRVYRVSRPLDRPGFRSMLRSLQGRRSVGTRALRP